MKIASRKNQLVLENGIREIVRKDIAGGLDEGEMQKTFSTLQYDIRKIHRYIEAILSDIQEEGLNVDSINGALFTRMNSSKHTPESLSNLLHRYIRRKRALLREKRRKK